MYIEDVKEIKFEAHKRGDLTGIIAFTLATIQQGLSTCTRQAMDIKRNGYSASSLWALKSQGLKYAVDNKDFLYNKCVHIIEKYGNESEEAIFEILKLFFLIPNIGIVKAGFIAQMLGFNISCLDSHNLKRLGLKQTHFNVNKKAKTKLIDKKIREYITLCQKKGSEYWWNTWCKNVAGNTHNKSLTDAQAVSRYHVDTVNLFYDATKEL